MYEKRGELFQRWEVEELQYMSLMTCDPSGIDSVLSRKGAWEEDHVKKAPGYVPPSIDMSRSRTPTPEKGTGKKLSLKDYQSLKKGGAGAQRSKNKDEAATTHVMSAQQKEESHTRDAQFQNGVRTSDASRSVDDLTSVRSTSLQETDIH